MSEIEPQKRGRRIAMTKDELDAFLADERTCRVATIGPDGPHATPLWFGWDGRCLWLYSITRSRRWADLMADPRIAVTVDAGEDYFELRGVEITGRVEVVGDVPRTGGDEPQLAGIEAEFSRKYMGGGDMFHDGKHAWLCVHVEKIRSWDFRKLADL